MRIKPLFFATAAALMATTPALAQQTAAPGTTPAPPTASAAVSLSQGATVYDTKGGVVGTIELVDGDNAVLSTGTNKVALPKTSFATSDKGPVIAMTRAEVDAAAASAKPDMSKVVTAGATVTDTAGNAVGKIEEVKDEYALLATANNKVRLPVSAFGPGTSGPVIAMTAAEIDAAAEAAAPAQPAAGADDAAASETPTQP